LAWHGAALLSPTLTRAADLTSASQPSAPALPGSASGIAFAQAGDTAAFPLMGTLFLVGLVLLAFLVVGLSQKRSNGAMPHLQAFWSKASRLSENTPQHLSTTRIDGMTKLHVIAWQNQQFLLAVTANVAPVVLASAPNLPPSMLGETATDSASSRTAGLHA
jgi:hypothetical protein